MRFGSAARAATLSLLVAVLPAAGEDDPRDIGIPVYVGSLRSAAEARARMRAQALRARLTNVHFVDAVDAGDRRAVEAWLGGRTLDHLASEACPEALPTAAFKVANFATNMLALDRIAAGAGPGLFLEDDANLRPNPGVFNRQFGALLDHLEETRGDTGWDMVMLGSCYERVRHIRQGCECVRPRSMQRGRIGLYLTAIHSPLCTHALLLSPAGATRMRALLAGWPAQFWEHTRGFDVANCSRYAASGDRMSGIYAYKLNVGHDAELRRLKDGMSVLAAWPHLVLQTQHVASKHHKYRLWGPFPCYFQAAFAPRGGLCGMEAYQHRLLKRSIYNPWDLNMTRRQRAAAAAQRGTRPGRR